MAETSTTITTATTTLIATLNYNGACGDQGVDVHAAGTFGGTTLTFTYSVDGGSSTIPVPQPGTVNTQISITSAGSFNFNAQRSTNAPILLYAVTTGGTGIDIDIKVVSREL